MLFLFLTCYVIRSEAQEVISPDAKKFCTQLRSSASSYTLKRVDSVAKNYRPQTISENDLMNIANSMSRGGDGAMAIAMMLSFKIAELSEQRAIELHRQSIVLVNYLYKMNSLRRDQILKSVNQ